MISAIWLSLACWSPAPAPPPPAPPEAEKALSVLKAEADEEARVLPETPAEGAAEGAEGTAEGAAEGAEGAEGAAESEAPPPIQPWKARTLSAPATLVDDFGKPVAILDRPQVELEVRAEDAIRRKVFCGSCVPATEGWIQASLLEKVP